ncbi:MAG: FAD-dependent oxidoreductase [Planctomycetota bacterium]|jgi:NADPH-dependent glutamate synthase beta subunit-like oxidoreductase/coenzyme F420-reducing hydrogenase delta subunit
MRDRDLTSGEVAQLKSTRDLMEQEWAPCRYNCPVHADVRGYIELAARGQFEAAADLVRDCLPFASVCGRICHHPCEANCRRCDVDQAVAVREVKRFVCEFTGAKATVHKTAKQDKAKVAIVGAGPAGMAAALELARLGYRPTVFEKFPLAGGIPATAIPPYRLPRDVIKQDTDWIFAHGVDFVPNCEIGKDKTVADLKAEGFEAVLIATGLAKSRMLPIPGSDNPRVLAVLEFLTNVSFDKPVDIGSKVLVIGGGNVAMDAARTARRLGGDVTAMCLENEEEMPAWDWERDEAEEEGVSFVFRRGPVEVLLDGEKVVGLKTRKVTSVFNDEGRFDPQYDDADLQDIECDTVIMAIGQMADMGFVEGSGLESDERGRMVYDAATHQTSQPEVFACGEIVTAPGSAVEACASGQRAATAIDMHLSGKAVQIDDTLPPYIETISPETAEKVFHVERYAVEAEDPAKRVANFEPIDRTYEPEIAMREARRCMSCGGGAEVVVDKCAACLTCLRVCPFDIPVVTDVARIESSLCQACGMCIAECPANAIVARSWSEQEDLQQATQKLAAFSNGRRIVAYVCGHHSPATAWSGTLEDAIAGVAEVYLPSISRLSAAEVLHTLEAGATGVMVVACNEGADRYPTAPTRVAKRVAQVRQLLSEIGIDAEKIQLVSAADKGRAAMREAMAAAVDRIEGKTDEQADGDSAES